MNDAQRWLLSIEDTGPGFPTDSGRPIAAMLDPEHQSVPSAQAVAPVHVKDVLGDSAKSADGPQLLREAGEGVGLSIVKRLCELLDATIEMQCAPILDDSMG
jgi:signal transduction histidine kinase